jgi:hypothetical protein
MDPLLGKDLETNNETTVVAMQQHGKHPSATMELLLQTVFSTRSMQRGYEEDNWVTKLVESQPVKRRLGGWYEMVTSLPVITCEFSSISEAVKKTVGCKNVAVK